MKLDCLVVQTCGYDIYKNECSKIGNRRVISLILNGRYVFVVVVLPLPLSHSAVWVYYFSFPVELGVQEVSPINLAVFPSESSLLIYLIIDEFTL